MTFRFGACGHPLRGERCSVCLLIALESWETYALGDHSIADLRTRMDAKAAWRAREDEANAWRGQPRTLAAASRDDQHRRNHGAQHGNNDEWNYHRVDREIGRTSRDMPAWNGERYNPTTGDPLGVTFMRPGDVVITRDTHLSYGEEFVVMHVGLRSGATLAVHSGAMERLILAGVRADRVIIDEIDPRHEADEEARVEHALFSRGPR